MAAPTTRARPLPTLQQGLVPFRESVEFFVFLSNNLGCSCSYHDGHESLPRPEVHIGAV